MRVSCYRAETLIKLGSINRRVFVAFEENNVHILVQHNAESRIILNINYMKTQKQFKNPLRYRMDSVHEEQVMRSLNTH